MPAAPRWTEADAARVASGEVSISSLADAAGCARQTVWKYFRHRGWSTKAIAPTAPANPLPAPRAAAGHSPSFSCIINTEDLAAIVPAVATNAGVLLLTHVERLLAAGGLGPAGLRQAGVALAQALDLLERLGLAEGRGDGQAELKIVEMTAAQVEAIRERQEAEYGQAFPADDGDADDPPAAPGHAPEPISATLGNDTALPATRHQTEPKRAEKGLERQQSLTLLASDLDLDRLERRLQEAGATCGSRWLRQVAVEHDVEPVRDAEALARRLAAAARRDADLAGRLDVALAAAGIA